MRKELCDTLCELSSNPSMTFLTGDLGFMALEPLQKVMGSRFVNTGVSEQNMISVAAAMAKDGWQAWCYSIAPFCFARPFEQIRNDICLHNLPVKLLGNGGGFGYGVMGPTHHAVDDYGVMLSLPFMQVFVPCFNEDVSQIINRAATINSPCYIRLGRGELPKNHIAPAYQPWRQLLEGHGPIVITVGPLGGTAWSALQDLPELQRPDLWVVSELPIKTEDIPLKFMQRIQKSRHLVVIEEHIAHGGVGSMLSYLFLKEGIQIKKFTHLFAKTLAMGIYGSQDFLRRQSGLSSEDIRQAVVSESSRL